MSPGCPPVSVVIPSRDRPELLHEAVQSVLGGAERPVEIVVVDQSVQRDEGVAKLQDDTCPVRYFWTTDRGVSSARNLGAANATGGVLAFIDDDVTVDRTWLATLVRAVSDAGEMSVVTGRVVPAERTSGGFAPSIKTEATAATYEGRLHSDVLFTGNMAIRRSTFERIGRFDERLGAGAAFPSAADNDLGFRLLDAGYRIVYEPGAIVFHSAWRTNRDFLRLRWRYGVGQGAFYTKHLRPNDLFMLRRMIADAGRRLMRLPLLALRDPFRAVGQLVYLAGVVKGAVKWLLAEKRKAADARPRA